MDHTIVAQQRSFCYVSIASTLFLFYFFSGKLGSDSDQINSFDNACSVIVQCLFSDCSVYTG